MCIYFSVAVLNFKIDFPLKVFAFFKAVFAIKSDVIKTKDIKFSWKANEERENRKWKSDNVDIF